MYIDLLSRNAGDVPPISAGWRAWRDSNPRPTD
jgi:hypothetical protein